MSGPSEEAGAGAAGCARLVRLLRGSMEAVVLALVALSPWAFGCVHPLPKLVLAAGLAALLGLWAVRLLVEWRLTWHRSPVALCLAGLFLLGVWQITPLSAGALDTVSPATARLYRQLLPSSPEVVAEGEAPETDQLFAGTTVSLYPGGTRVALIQILALIALFVVVRNNVASAASLRRLALVALVNGAALALFGLIHVFTASPHMIYWSIPSGGAVFGPFINRNHFACYVNLCFGLGFGALLATAAAAAGGNRAYASPGLLRRPELLWVGSALGLMLAASVLCLSRGGLLSLLAAAVPCLLLVLARRTRPSWGLFTGLLAAAVALGLVAWLGLGAVEARLATLWKGQALEDARWPLWRRTLSLAGDFPVWGSGYGTYQYLEPLRRPPASGLDFAYEHAHNDYLELLVEGGALGLALALAAVGLAYGRGARAYLRSRNAGEAGLILGALFGFGTVLVHSLGDFGMHIPAVPLLATVVAAQLCALGDRKAAALADSSVVSWRLGGLAPLGAAATAILVGLALMSAAWRLEAAERYRLAAGRCPAADAAAQDRRRDYLRAATALAPEDAVLQLELARAYHDEYERRGATEAAGDDLRTALRGYLRARALCPLLDEPHLRLAVHVRDMANSDPAFAYLTRAQLVLPYDARVWYLSGVQEAADGRREPAWQCWRRSLECSDRFLGPILEEGIRTSSAEEVAERLLPDQPALLLQAGALLEARPDPPASPRPFLEKGVRLLGAWATLSTEELRAKAHACRSLGQVAEARQAYEDLLARAPDQPAWRYEFAQMLYEAGQLDEARRQLVVLLRAEPANGPARDLYQTVVRDSADENDR
jgi:tetratricopeptide (TPR) repeat protein